jgi:hypothetical protein
MRDLVSCDDVKRCIELKSKYIVIPDHAIIAPLIWNVYVCQAFRNAISLSGKAG